MASEQVFPEERESFADDREIHLSEYWAIVRKHARLIALVLAIVLAATAVITLLQDPTYRATATLNVEKMRATPFDIDQGGSVYQSYDPEFLPTQTRLMQSREVAERVVDRLKLTSNPQFSPKVSGFFADAPVAQENPETARVAAAKALQDGVQVTPVRGTNLVELSYTGGDPEMSARIANALADAYIDWNLEAKFEVLGQANRFLATQSEQLRSEIDQLERQLQTYGREKGIVSLERESNVTMQNLETLNRDYAAAVGDRVAKEARWAELRNANPTSIADTLSNGLITQLRNEQARLEREYAEKLNVFKPEWPAMQQLKAQIDKGQQHLNSVIKETVAKARDNARSEYQTALRREESLKAVMAGQKNEALAQNSNAVEYNNLRLEIDSKKALLNSILNQQAETEVTSRLRGERVSNVRVVDQALPPSNRYRPSYRRNALLGAFLGLALGVGLAFFLEYLDRSLRTPQQVEQYLALPTLGIIPSTVRSGVSYGYGRLKKRDAVAKNEETAVELMPHNHPRSTIAEAYRDFRTALLLSQAGGLRSVVITSALPGEGKTSTAVNLAVVMGQLGRKVLIIDADLHKPRLHQLFSVTNRRGLVSVLAENLDPLTAIQASKVPNVSVMTCGPATPNPSGLLTSNAMIELLSVATRNFDFVIVDSPPVGPVADAIVLGHHSDGVVVCTRAGKTPRELVRRVRDRLAFSNVRILGVLINDLSADPTHKDAYYYKYYGEGYGYTVDPGDKPATGLTGVR